MCLFVLYVWTCLKENTLLWSSVVDFDNWENNKNHLLSKSKMTWNHSTSGTGRFTKATTPNCTLDVDPCIEVLEHVANCINDALQNQSHNTTNNISVLLCCNPNTSHKHLHCINCSHNKGPKANATKGSGQSHLQTGEQQWPVCGEIPSAENPRICHVTHIVNYATSPVQHQKEAELQRTHHTFVLVRCILLVLDGERSKANRKQDHPSCTEEASQGRYSHHAGILIGDICHHPNNFNGEGNVLSPAAHHTTQLTHPSQDEDGSSYHHSSLARTHQGNATQDAEDRNGIEGDVDHGAGTGLRSHDPKEGHDQTSHTSSHTCQVDGNGIAPNIWWNFTIMGLPVLEIFILIEFCVDANHGVDHEGNQCRNCQHEEDGPGKIFASPPGRKSGCGLQEFSSAPDLLLSSFLLLLRKITDFFQVLNIHFFATDQDISGTAVVHGLACSRPQKIKYWPHTAKVEFEPKTM